MPPASPRSAIPSSTDLDRKLMSSGFVLGGWCTIASSFSAELVAASGPDYVVIDLQHGLTDMGTLVSMLQAVALHGTVSCARIPVGDLGLAQRALDAGAMMIIVPMVNNADDAHEAVRSCKYPPLGERSFGPVRSRLAFADPLSESRSATKCLVQIETREALANLEAILDVPGVDGVYVGPADLAISMGELPGSRSPSLETALRTIAQACVARRLLPAVHATSADDARRMRELGYRACSVGTDSVWLSAAYAAQLGDARGDWPSPMEHTGSSRPPY